MGGEGRGEQEPQVEAEVEGDQCAHQTHEAHQALLWHTQYLDFLSDFMLVEEGRCVVGGAGGVGRAVCRALLDAPCCVPCFTCLSLALSLSRSLAPALARRRALSRIHVFFCDATTKPRMASRSRALRDVAPCST